MTDLELANLARLCKLHGIRRLRIADIEMEFGPTGEVNEKLIERFTKAFERGFPSDEEVLFHSAPGYIPNAEEPEPPKTTKGRGR